MPRRYVLMRHLTHVIAQTRVNFTPDFTALPGAGPFQHVINGVGAFALFLSLAGVIIGGAMWGIGSLSSNYHQAAVGKRATPFSPWPAGPGAAWREVTGPPETVAVQWDGR